MVAFSVGGFASTEVVDKIEKIEILTIKISPVFTKTLEKYCPCFFQLEQLIENLLNGEKRIINLKKI